MVDLKALRLPRSVQRIARAGVLLALLAARATAWSQAAPAPTAPTLVLRGTTVHTPTGPAIRHGIIVMRNGKIADVGPDVGVPAGAVVVDVSGKEITPGMIDHDSHIGAAPEELNESAVSFGPPNRMVDARDPDDRGWRPAAKHGC